MCNGPITITRNTVAQTVPCGHCQQCARRRTMSWTLRLLLEMNEHEFTDFITLTYAEPAPQKLSARDFELFIKRLRKSIPTRVRYFCCGEYGGKTSRPHWHVLLYGHRLPFRGLGTIEQWPHGHVYAGEIERSSAMYVCRYTLKSAVPTDKPQIIRCSRRPGIGLTALRYIAAQTAKKVPDMPYWPPVMRYQGKSYWLDRHAYSACVEAYLNAGGVLDDDAAPCNDWLEQPRSKPIDVEARALQKCFHHGPL